MATIQLAYSMEHSKPAVLSMEALDCQVQSLQVSPTVRPEVKVEGGSEHSNECRCFSAVCREAKGGERYQRHILEFYLKLGLWATGIIC